MLILQGLGLLVLGLMVGSILDLEIWQPRRREREELERRLRALEERDKRMKERERSVWASPPTEAMWRRFMETGSIY